MSQHLSSGTHTDFADGGTVGGVAWALMKRFLDRLIADGELTVEVPGGRIARFGDRSRFDCAVGVKVHTGAAALAIAANPLLKVGECYMNGTLSLTRGDLSDLMAIAFRNLNADRGTAWMRWLYKWRRVTRRIAQHNPIDIARKNVAHHYDLSDALYRTFLDGDRQYSCAYFPTEDATLEAAQLAKKRHLAAKLDLRPGQTVLDIGCGWGGLALYLARVCDVRVVGVTLSEEQHKVAVARAAEAGLTDRVDFRLQDYRTVPERFDRIVSVGMFEHVGVNHYREFFRRVKALLAPDGVALLHAIGSAAGPHGGNPWLAKYIFPGGYPPALSEVLPHIEDADLYVTDVEILRRHYADTLAHWRRRFHAAWDDVAALYDTRFCRMWDFYLAGCESAFRHGDQMVFQIQMAHGNDSVPIRRDYIAQAEDRLAEREIAVGQTG